MIFFETRLEIPDYIKATIQNLLKNIFSFDVVVEIKKKVKKRSLDANAYYWTLLSRLAEIKGISKSRQHNELLRDYGQIEMLGGQLLRIPIPDTEKAYNETLEATSYHIKPNDGYPKKGKDGIYYKTYYMLKGSSDYDTREMAKLINGLIWECEKGGMSQDEIMTPFEKAQLKERYGVDFETADKSVAV